MLAGDVDKAQCFNQALRDQGIFKSDGKCYPSLALSDTDLAMAEDAIAGAAVNL